MYLNRQLFRHLSWAAVLTLAACVKTEIIPEILEPKLTVTPATVSLTVGQTVTWASSDNNVLNISANGLATGLSNWALPTSGRAVGASACCWAARCRAATCWRPLRCRWGYTGK